MALFQFGNSALELVFLDTKAGPNAAAAAASGLASEADIFIGPLFSSSVQQVQNVLAGSAIPLYWLCRTMSRRRAPTNGLSVICLNNSLMAFLAMQLPQVKGGLRLSRKIQRSGVGWRPMQRADCPILDCR